MIPIFRLIFWPLEALNLDLAFCPHLGKKGKRLWLKDLEKDS